MNAEVRYSIIFNEKKIQRDTQHKRSRAQVMPPFEMQFSKFRVQIAGLEC
jgi:hypothetical protein